MKIAPAASVLVTGGSGALGWVVARLLADRCRVTATHLTRRDVPAGTTPAKLDLKDDASIAGVLEAARPDVVIHSAAATDPDACERDPAATYRINSDATFRLASLARQAGARVVFVSTDLVFDGTKGNYSEDDQPWPLSIYATSKFLAEEAVLEADAANLVVRSALIYGYAGRSAKTFLGRMLEALAEGQRIHLFTDQRRSPVLIDDLARGIILAIERDLAGIYHLGGADAVSRHEFGLEVCRAFGCDRGLLIPARQEEMDLPARRPLDVTLNSARFARATGFAPRGVRLGLEVAGRTRKAGGA